MVMSSMKYRVKLVLVICSDQGVLLIKDRKTSKYGLPFCLLQRTQQVDQTVVDCLKSRFRIDATEVGVVDVVNFTSPNVGGGSLSVICKVVVNTSKVKSSAPILWQLQTQHLNSITESDAQILRKFWGYSSVVEVDVPLFSSSSQTTHVAYSDGGSRGNPGHSAAAFVIYDNNGAQIVEGGEYLGITTSTVAEYVAVRLALESAIRIGAKSLECRIDNSTIVNHMNAAYVVKNRDLWPIHENIIDLVKQLERVIFSHVSRELNTKADDLVNQILDEYLINL